MALQSTGSSADQIQTGSASKRPAPPSTGQIRFNTDTSDLEIYEGGKWASMRPPVSSPITDNNRQLGLAFNKGLHLVNGDLEANLGRGLGFDIDNRIRLLSDGEIIISYEPQIASETSLDLKTVTTGGPIVGDLTGSRQISLTPPKESNGAFAIATIKMHLGANSATGSYAGTRDTSWCSGSWRAFLSGRNCYAATAADQTRIGAGLGLTVAHDVDVSGRGETGPQDKQWHLKIEQLRWDANKTEPINFNFTWQDWTRTSSVITYGAVRMVIIPFTIS